MGLESLFRTARVKEGSQGTAVLDVERQEIVEEARITDETDNAPTEYEHVTVASRTLESSLEDLEMQCNGETDSNHATASHIRYVSMFMEVLKSILKILQQVNHDEDKLEIDEVKYKSMVEQFKMQTLMSTFTAALILAWCNLVKTLQVDGAHAELLYNIGLLLSLFAMVFHMINVTLSSYCVSTYYEHTILKKKKNSVADFYSTFEVCQVLYTYALLLFAIAVMVMSFIV